jgi:MFS family permease
VKKTAGKKPVLNVYRDLREGMAYAYRSVPIRSILILLAFFSIFGYSFSVIMPVIAKEILHGNSSTLGFLMAGAGIGAILSALFLASHKNIRGFWDYIAVTTILVSLSLLGLSFAAGFPMIFILVLFIGSGMIMLVGCGNTIVQNMVEERMRGRVMSLYTLAFLGMMPFGSFMAGSLTHILGPRKALLICGISCMLASLAYLTQLGKIKRIAASAEKRM